MKKPVFAASAVLLCGLLLFPLSGTAQTQQTQGRIVEEIVARVNNEVITLSQLEEARRNLVREIEQECKDCTAARKDEMVRDKEKNLLRDLIDRSLLVQRAQEANVNVDADVVRQLDAIRRNNNLKDMEELARTYEQTTGLPFEDFRARIRDELLTQRVIRGEVVREITIGREQLLKYYQEHEQEFHRPEMVFLSEIFLGTEGKSPEEVAQVELKAAGLLDQARQGGDFLELARRNSEGSTAERGGELGGFERGQLAKELEDQVFQMKRGEITDVIRTQTGLLILRLDERFEEGLQPLEKVEGEIMNRLYGERMPDKLRDYLDRLRQENYIYVKPGYTDAAGVPTAVIEEVEPELPPEDAEKKKKKWFWPFGAGE